MLFHINKMTQPVELVYKDKLFKLHLTSYEINRCTNDATFYEELGSKYYQMYLKGHISATDTTAEDVENETSSIDVDSFEDPENDDPAPTVSSNAQYEKFIWTRPAVLILLTELEKRKTKLMQPHKKRVLFGEIAAILQNHNYNVLWESCERKWRGMQATYKKMVNKQNKTGTNAIRWEFFDKVGDIIANDPAYNALATVSVGVENNSNISAQVVGAYSNSTPKATKNAANKKSDNTESFCDLKEELKEITCAMDNSNKIQEERNAILGRIAAALEKLSD